MKRITTLTISILVAISFNASSAQTFHVSSIDIPQNNQLTEKQVFQGFGCSGGNISPQLAWQNPPEGTKSFAITV